MPSKLQVFLLTCGLLLAAVPASVRCEQDCPGRAPWRLKCPQYCCLEELDEPLEGQYCCSACSSSFDLAVRTSFACKANTFLHKTWAVVLMSCGVAFIVLVLCTCCCCCCCTPCRNRRRRRCCSRSYSLGKVPPQHLYQQQYQYNSYRGFGSAGGSSASATNQGERTPLLLPSAPPPPPPSGAAMASSYSAHYPQMKEPPPYQEATPGANAPGASCRPGSQAPPPIYRP